MNERDNRMVGLAAWALQNLEPVGTDKLSAGGFYQEAGRINTARVAVDQLVREIRGQERRVQNAEHENRRLKFLLRKLFTADDEYGTGFYNTDKWLEPYNALRAEVGTGVKE